jgi:hypothetical protein
MVQISFNSAIMHVDHLSCKKNLRLPPQWSRLQKYLSGFGFDRIQRKLPSRFIAIMLIDSAQTRPVSANSRRQHTGARASATGENFSSRMAIIQRTYIILLNDLKRLQQRR